MNYRIVVILAFVSVIAFGLTAVSPLGAAPEPSLVPPPGSWQLDFEGEPASILPGDFEPDGDVDGSDLAVFAAGGTDVSLQEFAENLGKTYCL